MTKWLIIITLAITLGIFGVLYSQSTRQSSPAGGADAQSGNAIPVVHSFKDGVHQYSGQLKLAQTSLNLMRAMHKV